MKRPVGTRYLIVIYTKHANERGQGNLVDYYHQVSNRFFTRDINLALLFTRLWQAEAALSAIRQRGLPNHHWNIELRTVGVEVVDNKAVPRKAEATKPLSAP